MNFTILNENKLVNKFFIKKIYVLKNNCYNNDSKPHCFLDSNGNLFENDK